MCDKFDMSFCFKHCLNGSNVMRDYKDMELCIRRKQEDGSCNYCYFELGIREGSKEHSKWKKLLDDYLCYCWLPKDKSVETKKELMEFMNEHVEFTDDMDDDLRYSCPYYTEVLMSQYNKKRRNDASCAVRK